MASTDGAPVPREGEQKPEDTDDEKEPGQSEEPVSVAPQVPGTDQHLHKFTIGTKNAFQKGDAYEYEESKEEKEVYICKKGTESCGANQVLVLRRENKWWIAWAADATDQKKIIYGTPVFRTEAQEITTNNCAHMWQWNLNKDARTNDDGDWSGELWCTTRVNEVEDTQKDQSDENMDEA